MRRMSILFVAALYCTACGGSAVAPPGTAVPTAATTAATFTLHGDITFPSGGVNVSNPCQHQGPYSAGAAVYASARGVQSRSTGRITGVTVTADRQSCKVTFVVPGVPVTAGPYSVWFGSNLFPSPVPASVAVGSTVHMGFGGAVYGEAG